MRPLLILLLACALAACEAGAPAAERGVAEVSLEDLESVVALDGTWRALAGADSLAFAAFGHDDAAWKAVPFPALFESQGFPDRGLVWYRLHLRLPAGAPPLRGRIDYARNAYEVYVARPGEAPVRVAGAGRPALDSGEAVPSRRAASFALPADTALVLSIRTSNHRYGGGGMIAPVYLGSEAAMAGAYVRGAARVFGLMGACLLLAAIFGLAWLTNRRDVAALVVVFITTNTLLREVTTAGVLEPLVFDAVGYTLRVYIETTSAWFASGLFSAFLWLLYPLEFLPLKLGPLRLSPPASTTFDEGHRRKGRPPLPRWRRRVNTWLVLLPVFITLTFFTASVVGGMPWLDVLSDVHKRIIPAYILIGVGLAAQLAERRRPMARAFLTGYLLLSVAGGHDLLVRFGLLPGPFLSTFAFFAFALILAALIARRNARNAHFVRQSAAILREQVERRTQALHRAREAAEAANEAKTHFLSAVTHELRTPLAAIKGYADLLGEELHDRLEAHERSFLRTISTSSLRLVGLVSNLLDLDRAESGRLELTLGTVDLAAVADEAVATLYPLAAEKGLLLLARHERAPLHVEADEERLRQVLVNLVGNALKFTDDGRVRVRTGRTADGGVFAAVEDTGPGIAPDFVPRLFERFSQDDEGRRRAGSGLGLAISHELVTRMGGRVEVETALGEGTTFTVVLRSAADAVDASTPLAPAALPA